MSHEVHAFLCPDCGVLLWAPVVIDSDGDPTINEDEFEPMFRNHIMAEPEAHPQFTIRNETDTDVPEHLPLLCLYRESVYADGDPQPLAVYVCLAADDHTGEHDLHRFTTNEVHL